MSAQDILARIRAKSALPANPQPAPVPASSPWQPDASSIIDRIRSSSRIVERLAEIEAFAPDVEYPFVLRLSSGQRVLHLLKTFVPDHAWSADEMARSVMFSHENDLVRFKMLL